MENMAKAIEMAEIPNEELASIVKQGAILRLPYLEGRLHQARKQLKHFEQKHGTTLDNLRSQGLPEDADYAMHEDFIEWECSDDVLQVTETAVRSIKILLEKLEDPVGIH